MPCLGLGHFPSSSSHPEGPGIEMFQSYIFSVRIETASLLFFQIILYIEKSSIIIEKTIILVFLLKKAKNIEKHDSLFFFEIYFFEIPAAIFNYKTALEH